MYMAISKVLSTFVISLERDTERRAHMANLLNRLDLKAEFINAVDGRAMPQSNWNAYDRKKTLRVYGVDMLETEIGCYLSHYRLYERMLREDIDIALIMEDDIECTPEFPQIIADLIADPDPEWLVVRLETQRGRVREAKKPLFTGRCVKKMRHAQLYKLNTHILGFGAYLIRKEGAQRMLEYGRRIFMPIDQTMDRFWENGIAPYIVRPIPVFQNPVFQSRIGARPPGRNKDQPLFIRLQSRMQRMADGLAKRIYAITNR